MLSKCCRLKVKLDGNFARVQLVVRKIAEGSSVERAKDLTHAASYETSDPKIVTVSPAGQLLAGKNGRSECHAEDGRANIVRAGDGGGRERDA